MEMIISIDKLESEMLLQLEEDSKKIFHSKIGKYMAQLNKYDLDLKISYFWENSENLSVSQDRLSFENGYTMYIEVYLYNGLNRIEIAGGETDDLGYFASILHIKRKKQNYSIYVNYEFDDFESRAEETILSIERYGYT